MNFVPVMPYENKGKKVLIDDSASIPLGHESGSKERSFLAVFLHICTFVRCANHICHTLFLLSNSLHMVTVLNTVFFFFFLLWALGSAGRFLEKKRKGGKLGLFPALSALGQVLPVMVPIPTGQATVLPASSGTLLVLEPTLLF